MNLAPGLSATVQLTVSDADTAVSLRCGDVPVLATPRIVALVEEATVAAVAPLLDAGATTVGSRVELDHLAATAVGATVTAHARLVAVDGRRLAFDVELTEGSQVVARGVIGRVVVDREHFVKLAERP